MQGLKAHVDPELETFLRKETIMVDGVENIEIDNVLVPLHASFRLFLLTQQGVSLGLQEEPLRSRCLMALVMTSATQWGDIAECMSFPCCGQYQIRSDCVAAPMQCGHVSEFSDGILMMSLAIGAHHLPDSINGRVTVLNHVQSAAEVHTHLADSILEQENPENYAKRGDKVEEMAKRIQHQVRPCHTGSTAADIIS